MKKRTGIDCMGYLSDVLLDQWSSQSGFIQPAPERAREKDGGDEVMRAAANGASTAKLLGILRRKQRELAEMESILQGGASRRRVPVAPEEGC